VAATNAGRPRVFDRVRQAFMTAPRGPAHGRPFLTAEWRYAVMSSYEIERHVLEPLVPAGTLLDAWHGTTLVSVVGFRFLRTRLLGVPVPFHTDFDEVNLRFYVRRELPAETRRGVVFVRELVPRAAVSLVARLAYNEPYRTVPMRSTAPTTPVEAPGRLAYEWRIGSEWHRLAAAAVGPPAVPVPDSSAAFVTEHSWGYTRQRDGGTVEYQVTHPRWRVWQAESPVLSADVTRVWGSRFVSALSRPPASTLIAEGSAVAVFRPRRLSPLASDPGRLPPTVRTPAS
jgi:uncharacterized protein